jgi:dipeptidyl aminopeptidase/acylaminoacyl peptidase
VEVKLEQDLTTPPRIRAINPKTGQSATLIDLNPEFNQLTFGLAKTITLHVKGFALSAGLYLPPDYSPGKRYPLVIQTHGYIPTEFSMDGRSEWSSGFSARPLAAHGIVVLQTYEFKNKRDHDRLVNGEEKRFGSPPEYAARNLATSVYETAIDYLRASGLIDTRRVGIVGFSRTVCFVAYALTHSRYHFAAASLVDGIDCGYFQHLAFPIGNEDDNLLNGAKSPFSKEGLGQWIKRSPSFNLDRVDTPVRLLALQPFSVLQGWEWFVGLKLQRKPVDFLELADASHLVVKPWERMVAQQGLVDWFSFWLKGEQDPDPAKASQYDRWHALRQLQHDQAIRNAAY